MAETDANVAIWHLTPGDIELSPNEKAPQLLRLSLGAGTRIVLDSGADDTPQQAEAMRRLADVAAEAAEELERRMAAREAGTDDD